MDKGKAPLTCPPAVCRGSAPPTESEPDEGFEWVTPDEGTRLPFVRSPEAALQLAQEWDLCISGDGLLHLQHIGAESVYIPLAQVRVDWGQACCTCATLVHSQFSKLRQRAAAQQVSCSHSVWRVCGNSMQLRPQHVCSDEVLGRWGHSSWLCPEDKGCTSSIPACSQPQAACPSASASRFGSSLLLPASLHGQAPGLALLLAQMVLRHTSMTPAGPLLPAG